MLTVHDAIALVREFTSTIAKKVPLEQFPDPHVAQATIAAAHHLIVKQDGLQKKVAPVRFEFRPGEAHLEYGKDLIRNGLFVPPHKYTLLSWPEPTIGEDGHVIDNGGRSYGLVIDIREHQPNYLLVVGFKSSDDEKFDIDTLAFLDLSIAADTPQGMINFIPMDMHAAYWNLAGRPARFFPRDVLAKDTATTIGGVVGCVAALASKGVLVSKPTAKDEKLSLRHPLPKRQQRSDIRVTLNMPSQRGDGEGDSHASPVPHWRRGHIRHIERAGEIVKIPIPPCLVNADEDTKAAMKQYLVNDGDRK